MKSCKTCFYWLNWYHRTKMILSFGYCNFSNKETKEENTCKYWRKK